MDNRPKICNNADGQVRWNKPYSARELLSMIGGVQKGGFPSLDPVTFSPVSLAYSCGVLHPNGKIYFIPGSANYCQEFDPRTGVIKNIGGDQGTTTDKWVGAVVASNGRIYMICHTGIVHSYLDVNRRVVVNLTGTVEAFYSGGVLANNGMIYCVPTNAPTATQFAEINPFSNTWLTIGNTTVNSYYGGCLGANGKIYCAPYTGGGVTRYVGIFDPASKELREIPVPRLNTDSNNSHYQGAVLAPNGKAYFIPASAYTVMEFDPITEKGKLIGPNFGSSSSKWSGGFLGPDGMIYGISSTSTTMLQIDWRTGTVKTFGKTAVSSAKYAGAVLHPDGNAYCVTRQADDILKMKFLGCRPNAKILTHRQINHY